MLKSLNVKRVLFLIISTFMMFSCATEPQLSKERIREITIREYNYNYDKVFEATKTVFLDSGITISNLSEKDGMITGVTTGLKKDRKTKNIFNLEDYNTYVYSVIFSKMGKNKVKLRLLIVTRVAGSFGTVLSGTNIISSTSSENLTPTYKLEAYNYIFDKIQQELYR